MKNKHILIISAFSIVITLNQQSLHAYSETAREMEKGADSGEEAAGPVGAAFGGLFGGAVGLVKDTGDTVAGRTDEEREMRDQREEEYEMRNRRNARDEMYMADESDMDEPRPYRQSETSREMEKGSASGEEAAGPVGAAVGGLFGAGVGLVEDTGEFVTGQKAEEYEEQRPEEEEMPMIRYTGEMNDGNLTIDEVE